MNIICLLKGHDMDGCICKRCKATPSWDAHDWDGCTCKKCGQVRDEDHDCDGCFCRRCGKRAPAELLRLGVHSFELVSSEYREYEAEEWYGGHFCFHDVKETVETYRCKHCGAEKVVVTEE